MRHPICIQNCKRNLFFFLESNIRDKFSFHGIPKIYANKARSTTIFLISLITLNLCISYNDLTCDECDIKFVEKKRTNFISLPNFISKYSFSQKLSIFFSLFKFISEKFAPIRCIRDKHQTTLSINLLKFTKSSAKQWSMFHRKSGFQLSF